MGGRCPRCGKGRLYDGLLTVAPACPACGLDFASLDTGDGAIAFVVLILGAIVVAMAILLDILAAPPLWVHLVVWTPVVIVGAVLLLRLVKGWLIAQHYRRIAT